MTGPYTFKKHSITNALDQWSTPPGHWAAWKGVEKAASGDIPRVFVVISCPLCKTHGMIPHQISDKGVLHPSVVCPTEGCKFHTQPVTLEGWDLGFREDLGGE